MIVLNNSTISGLAAKVAAELRAKGWKVVSVGNLQGIVAETTVYLPDLHEMAAARHLGREFSSIHRIGSDSAAHIERHGRDLTLVVTRDWDD